MIVPLVAVFFFYSKGSTLR